VAAPVRRAQDVEFSVEGCTGWRYVVEELQRARITAHLAEPAETANRRGSKRRAKTDWADARLLRDLLIDGRVPESWIPPAHVLETRARVRLYKDLLEERTSWQQRVHATLFHQGIPVVPKLGAADGQRRLDAAELSAAGRQAVQAGVRQIERLSQEMTPLRRELARLSSRQPGCRAPRKSPYGLGGLLSVAVWAELGDCRRFSSSYDALRHTGLDITVHDSDGKRTRGHITRQGPPVLRWALYEAALYASRPASPDYACFCRVRERIDGQRALLSVARKLARRCYHTLRDLGEDALQSAARRRMPRQPSRRHTDPVRARQLSQHPGIQLAEITTAVAALLIMESDARTGRPENRITPGTTCWAKAGSRWRQAAPNIRSGLRPLCRHFKPATHFGLLNAGYRRCEHLVSGGQIPVGLGARYSIVGVLLQPLRAHR
jgi:transposase